MKRPLTPNELHSALMRARAIVSALGLELWEVVAYDDIVNDVNLEVLRYKDAIETDFELPVPTTLSAINERRKFDAFQKDELVETLHDNRLSVAQRLGWASGQNSWDRHALLSAFDTCQAVQLSTGMYCKRCALSWDVNDPCPPKCAFKEQM